MKNFVSVFRVFFGIIDLEIEGALFLRIQMCNLVAYLDNLNLKTMFGHL